ncbi:hypothetical protein C8R44DRAFT_889916 [Mycena epipterygia]|nr:hypothetical protein C8R44DRAFT_889916 [Mycena epipterygia]
MSRKDCVVLEGDGNLTTVVFDTQVFAPKPPRFSPSLTTTRSIPPNMRPSHRSISTLQPDEKPLASLLQESKRLLPPITLRRDDDDNWGIVVGWLLLALAVCLGTRHFSLITIPVPLLQLVPVLVLMASGTYWSPAADSYCCSDHSWYCSLTGCWLLLGLGA